MRIPRPLALVLFLAGAAPASAQMVVTPEPKLDSTQALISEALYHLRDSLQFVEAASARLARDRSATSDAVLRSRALTMAERCEAAVRVSDAAREVVVRSARPEPDRRSDLPKYLQALDTLRKRLVDCQGEFTRLARPEFAEELRGYGIGRGERVQEAIRAYDPAIKQYFTAATGRSYWPYMKGAGATPTGS